MSSFGASTRNTNGGGGFTSDSVSGGGGNKKAKIESNLISTTTHHEEFEKGKTVVVAASSSGGWIFPDDEAGIFESIRQHLKACPNVPMDHPAMKAALMGLDQEQRRRERDAKLKAKFSNEKKGVSSSTTEMAAAETGTAATAAAAMKKDTSSVMKDAVTVERPLVESNEERTAKEEEEVVDDWQDVAVGRAENAAADDAANSPLPSSGDVVHEPSIQHHECSYVGRRLAQESIASLARHQVRVRSPLAAVAVVLHAALRLPTVGMECTGLPENKNKATKGGGVGFAAPVRPLPKSVLMPPNWDGADNANPIQFRYRKTGLGSVVLRVQGILPDDESGSSNRNINDRSNVAGAANDVSGGAVRVHVTLHPTRLAEPCNDVLQFDLDDHVNMDSFQAAQSRTSRVEPALHYKALAGLLTAFVNSFDLGALNDNDETNSGSRVETDAPQAPLPYTDTSITMQPGTTTRPVFTANVTSPHIRDPSIVQPPPQRPHQSPPQPSPYVFPGTGLPHPSTIPTPGGDFGHDLLPGGGRIPLGVGGFDRGNPIGGGSGMLMGPDHPIFSKTNPDPSSRLPHPQFPGGGGGPLPPGWPQPRHDYFGPNGINGPTHPHGEPNPDHLRMPGGLGDGFGLQPPNVTPQLPPGARRWGGGGNGGPGSRGNQSSSMNNMFL